MLQLASLGEWVKRRQIVLLIVLIIAVGTILRFYDIGVESVWDDEVYSMRESSMGIMEIADSSNHPPLYFLILNLWIKLFGTGEVATRSLSAIFSISSILVIFLVGNTLFNKRVALISALLSAISYFHIYYAQEVRDYSLLLLLSLLSYLFFIKILKGDSKWYYAGYFISSVLLAYTHIFGIFIIGAQIAYLLLFWKAYRMQRSKLLITMAATIAALLPLAAILGRRIVTFVTVGFWIREPGLGSLYYNIACFAGGDPAHPYLLLIFFLLVIISLFSIKLVEGKLGYKRPLESLTGLTWNVKFGYIKEISLLLLWLSLPIAVPFVISKISTPILLAKYTIGASPALYLLVARGISNLSARWILYPTLILVIFFSGIGLQRYYTQPVKAQWREVAHFVEANSKAEGDAIIFCPPYHRMSFDYYYVGNLPEYGIDVNVQDTQELAAFLDKTCPATDRLWLILGRDEQAAPIRGYLQDRLGSAAVILERKFFGATVLLFDTSAR